MQHLRQWGCEGAQTDQKILILFSEPKQGLETEIMSEFSVHASEQNRYNGGKDVYAFMPRSEWQFMR